MNSESYWRSGDQNYRESELLDKFNLSSDLLKLAYVTVVVVNRKDGGSLVFQKVSKR